MNKIILFLLVGVLFTSSSFTFEKAEKVVIHDLNEIITTESHHSYLTDIGIYKSSVICHCVNGNIGMSCLWSFILPEFFCDMDETHPDFMKCICIETRKLTDYENVVK